MLDETQPYGRLVALLELAGTVWKPEGVGLWLASPNPQVDGLTPLELLRTGELERVEQLVNAAAEGTFV